MALTKHRSAVMPVASGVQIDLGSERQATTAPAGAGYASR